MKSNKKAVPRRCLAVLLSFFLPILAAAQVNQRNPSLEATPTFFFEAITFASEQKNRAHVDVYLQVPHEELRFVKEGDQYLARYDVSLAVYTQEHRLVQDRSWTVEVREADFAQTTSSRQYSLTQRGVELEPGSYEFVVQLQDQDSKKNSQIRKTLLVSDFEKDTLSLSDIMLVNRLTTEGDKRKIVPNISGNVAHVTEGFFLFFETYNTMAADSLDLLCRVYNSKKDQVYQREEMQAATGAKTQSFFKIENANLPVGSYIVTMNVSPSFKNHDVTLHAMTSRSFTVRWSDIPISIADLDKAIDQMRYVAKESDMEYIRSATDGEEKRKRFLAFWAKRDPDPSTPRNEILEEYYRRVEFANKNFGHYLEGWRSDRGMVYILFGAPENIDRHPFDINTKPYEIWYYYQLQREFIFVDETGFGDYRLKYPTTDLWGRIR